MEALNAIDDDTRDIRLFCLANVMQWHHSARSSFEPTGLVRPVILNDPIIGPPVIRQFSMDFWDTGTAACCLGSYALSIYGHGHFIMSDAVPHDQETPRFDRANDPHACGFVPMSRFPVLACDWTKWTIDAAAFHFGITSAEANYLFNSDSYYATGTRKIMPEDCLERIERVRQAYEQGTDNHASFC
ncbi:MAG: hypothetical protein ACK4RS_00020 [Thiothrix sp.]